jgi:hypothetical protein
MPFGSSSVLVRAIWQSCRAQSLSFGVGVLSPLSSNGFRQQPSCVLQPRACLASPEGGGLHPSHQVHTRRSPRGCRGGRPGARRADACGGVSMAGSWSTMTRPAEGDRAGPAPLRLAMLRRLAAFPVLCTAAQLPPGPSRGRGSVNAARAQPAGQGPALARLLPIHDYASSAQHQRCEPPRPLACGGE